MTKERRTIALCTWSLGNDPDLVFRTLEATGLSHVHLGLAALDPFRAAIRQRRIGVSATMVGFPQEDYSTLDSIRRTGGLIPDECWEENRRIVLEAVATTAGLGVGLLSFHAGFIDHNDAAAYRTFCARLRGLADAAQRSNVVLLMETGQESAEDLRRCLEHLGHPALGVNFDPANMVLYGKGDPIAAVGMLAPWIRHVHIKDALPATAEGEWGTEVPWGDGAVGSRRFLRALEAIGFEGALAIEREAGDDRAGAVRTAVQRLAAAG